MKNTLRKIAAFGSSGIALLLPALTVAQTGGTTGGSGAPTLPPAPFSTLDELLGADGIICGIFRWLFAFLVLIAVIFILLAAFKYITSAGDPEKVKAANKQIAFAAIAIVIAFIARVIPNIALNLVGSATGVATC